MSAWTKRSKTSGDFMAVKKPAAKKKGRQKVQGRAAGEDVKVFDFLEVVITAAAMAAAVNSFERALGVPGALEEFGGDALPRFTAGQFNRKAFTSSIECHLHICNRSFVEGAPTSRAYPTHRDRAHANIACVGIGDGRS